VAQMTQKGNLYPYDSTAPQPSEIDTANRPHGERAESTYCA
jgi:hypothetical protein